MQETNLLFDDQNESTPLNLGDSSQNKSIQQNSSRPSSMMNNFLPSLPMNKSPSLFDMMNIFSNNKETGDLPELSASRDDLFDSDDELTTFDFRNRKKTSHEILVAKQTLKDLLHHKPIDYELRDPFTLQVYKFYQTKTYRRILTLIILIQLFTIFFERARSSEAKSTNVYIIYGIQLFCLLLHAADLAGKYWYMGGKSFFMSGILYPHRHWNMLKTFITIYSIFDVIIVLMIPQWFELSRVLRPFYLLESRHRLRHLTVNAVKTSLEVFPVIVLIFIWLTFYAILGFLLFGQNIPEFKNIPDAWLNLFVLITTANYPNVMTNAYIYNTWNFWYFFIFLLVGLFALQNILVAVTYNTWRSKTTMDVKDRIKKREQTLILTFEMLSSPNPLLENENENENEKIVTEEVWNQLWKVLRPSYSDQVKKDLFNVIKTNHSEHLSCEEFKKIFPLLKLYIRQKIDHGLQSNFTKFLEKSKERLRYLFDLRFLGYGIIDVIVVISSIFLLIGPSPIPPTFETNYIDFVVVIVYMIEVGLKIFAYGLRDYWDKLVNKYDSIVSIVAFLLRIFIFFDSFNFLDNYSNHQTNLMIRAILLFRFLRVFRGLRNFKSYQALFNTLIELPHFFSSFVVFIFCIYYVYAAIGMELFGDKLKKDNPKLNGTEYFENDYFKYNFNNFERSIVVLFYLMVVNNWYIIMDACAKVVGGITKIYFISYYILVVWIFLNLVIAFLIEQFLSSYENKLGLKEVRVDSDLIKLKNQLEEKGYSVKVRENLDTIQEDTLGI